MNSKFWAFFIGPCLMVAGIGCFEGNTQKVTFFVLLAMAFRIMCQVTFYGDRILGLLEKEKKNE